MEDDFGFLTPELQHFAGGKQQQQQQYQHAQQQQQSIGQSGSEYSPQHFSQHATARQTPPPAAHSSYYHHSNVTPLSPSLAMSSFSSFPLPSPPSSSAAPSSAFPLPDDLDGGLLSSASDGYHQMLLSDVDLPALSSRVSHSPLASFDNPFLVSDASSTHADTHNGSGSGSTPPPSSSSYQSSLTSYPHPQHKAQNAQSFAPPTQVKRESEVSTLPLTSYSHYQQQQSPLQPTGYPHSQSPSHPHHQSVSPLSRYGVPGAAGPAAVSADSSGSPPSPSSSSPPSRSTPSPHGRSIDEYLAMHAQQQQQRQQQQQQQQSLSPSSSSHPITNQPSSSPVSAAASLLSNFQSPPAPLSAGASPTYSASSRSPHSVTSTAHLPASRSISPLAPPPSTSALPSSMQYEQSAFNFPPPAALSAVAGHLKANAHSPQQQHNSLQFANTSYSAPHHSAISSLVSSPPSTSPSPPHGQLRQRGGQQQHAALTSHAPIASISPQQSTHSLLASHPNSHSHSPSASAGRTIYPPQLYSQSTVGSASHPLSLSDGSSSLSPTTAAHLQLQHAQLQRQMHAAHLHQLQQHDYTSPTSAAQLYAQQAQPPMFVQQLSHPSHHHTSLPSSRPVNVSAGIVKLEGGGGLSSHPPPPSLITTSHPAFTLTAPTVAAAAAPLPSSLLGSFNVGTFAAPAAKTKAGKAGGGAAKGGLKRTLTSSASTPSLTSLPAQQAKSVKGRGARGGVKGGERSGVPDVHRKKNRLARKAELARASRKRKKAYLGELEDEVSRLTARIAQAEAIKFGQAMDAAAAEAAHVATSSLSPSTAHNSTMPRSTMNASSPTAGAAESPHELHLDKLRIAEQLDASPHQHNQSHSEPSSAPPPTITSSSLPSFSSPIAHTSAASVSSLPRVQSDSNLSLSSSLSSVDASMDSFPSSSAVSSFACSAGELVGRSQYFLSAIRSSFCPGDQEKFALFGFQQAAEIHAQQQQLHSSDQTGESPAVGPDGQQQQTGETTMADDSGAERGSVAPSGVPSDQVATEGSGSVDSASAAAGFGVSNAQVPHTAASASAVSSPPSTQLSPSSSSDSPSTLPSSPSAAPTSSSTGTSVTSSVSALHTFWLTLLRSELGVDDSQLEQLRRLRDTVAPFTAQLRSLESRMAALQPTVLSHQQRMLELRRRIRSALSEPQFERLQKWLDKNEWVDHMLTSQVPALALAAQHQQQQQQQTGSSHQHSGGSSTSGMPRTASGTRLSSAAAKTSKRAAAGSDDDEDEDDEEDEDSDEEDGEGATAATPSFSGRKKLHSRSMSIAEEQENLKEENE